MKKSVSVSCAKCGSSEEILVEKSAISHICRFCSNVIELEVEKKQAKSEVKMKKEAKSEAKIEKEVKVEVKKKAKKSKSKK